MPEDKLKIIHCQCHKIALCQTKHLHFYWLAKCRQNSYKKTAPKKNGKECDGSDKSVDWLETCCYRTMPLMGDIKARRQPENNEGFLWQVLLCYYAHRLNGAKLLLETKPSSSFESVFLFSIKNYYTFPLLATVKASSS
ncbi:hypothetical protein T4E_10071 [Trichinella pseudospiralis]|uniref:Uncharacterized protein n=1 Tax=Trichinella pseudospiralis TaxID=6337 RepID=A0A0V0XFI0_TRIPS|nr:hypothetical protein T4E_10071 [Trichinella pseudospiralis]